MVDRRISNTTDKMRIGCRPSVLAAETGHDSPPPGAPLPLSRFPAPAIPSPTHGQAPFSATSQVPDRVFRP